MVKLPYTNYNNYTPAAVGSLFRASSGLTQKSTSSWMMFLMALARWEGPSEMGREERRRVSSKRGLGLQQALK